jgi:hypothetical protein
VQFGGLDKPPARRCIAHRRELARLDGAQQRRLIPMHRCVQLCFILAAAFLECKLPAFRRRGRCRLLIPLAVGDAADSGLIGQI